MKKILVLTFLLSILATDVAMTQDLQSFCRHYHKKKPFALLFPNLAVCLNAAQGHDEIIGTIEWCRKSYTRVGVDECGRTIQWRATDITYRYVLCNGAYGECFTRTQIDGPIEYVEVVDTSAANAASCGKCGHQGCSGNCDAKNVPIFK